MLEPGDTWTVTARGLSYQSAALDRWRQRRLCRLRRRHHGAGRRRADARRRRQRAAEARRRDLSGAGPVRRCRFPIVPWPQQRRRCPAGCAVPAGLDLQARGRRGRPRRPQAFGELVDSLFPVEGIVRPAAEGGLPVSVSLGRRIWRRRPMRSDFRRPASSVSASTRTGLALRADHARPDPARRAPSPRDLPVSGRRRDPRRAGARLARHPSRCRPAVLRHGRDQAAS